MNLWKLYKVLNTIVIFFKFDLIYKKCFIEWSILYCMCAPWIYQYTGQAAGMEKVDLWENMTDTVPLVIYNE